MKDNKIIAEFMGVYSDENGYDYSKIGNKGINYHKSWDWLMPVVQKIESLGYVFTIQGGKAEYNEMTSKPKIFIAKDKMSSTYKAVVKFINQLNFMSKQNILIVRIFMDQSASKNNKIEPSNYDSNLRLKDVDYGDSQSSKSF